MQATASDDYADLLAPRADEPRTPADPLSAELEDVSARLAGFGRQFVQLGQDLQKCPERVSTRRVRALTALLQQTAAEDLPAFRRSVVAWWER
jgi:hypothetical protein